MFFYFGVTKTVTATRSKFVSVCCEKCACSYFYELTRNGVGSTVAHYGVDLSSLGSTAEQKAELNVKHQLAIDADLVPCPKCHWINDELIERYRNGRFEHWTIFARNLAVACIAGTLIWGLLVYMAQQGFRDWFPYVVSPAILGVFIAATIFAVRRWREYSIQPNRNYPEEPTLPMGTPPALVLNDAQELVTARPDSSYRYISIDQHSMAFQIGRHAIDSSVCCVCLGNAAPAASLKVNPILDVSCPIPLCTACSRKLWLKRWGQIIGVSLLVSVVTSLLAFLAGVNEEGIVVVILILSAISGVLANLFFKFPIRATVADSSRGMLRLSFTNPNYRSHIYETVPIKEVTPEKLDFSFLQNQETDSQE